MVVLKWPFLLRKERGGEKREEGVGERDLKVILFIKILLIFEV